MFIHFLHITFLFTNTILCFKKNLCQPEKHLRNPRHSFSQESKQLEVIPRSSKASMSQINKQHLLRTLLR